MKKKLSIYLLVLALFFGMLTPMAPIQAAGTSEIDISDKQGGLLPLVELEMTEEAETVFANAKAMEKRVYSFSAEEKAYWNQFSNDYYYTYYLNDVERAFWDEMERVSLNIITSTENCGYVDAAEEYCFDLNENTIIFYDTSISNARRNEIVNMFMYSHPQYYFWWYGFLPYDGAIALLAYRQEFGNGTTRKMATQKFTSRVDAWLADIKSQARPEEKVKRAHDIMCQNTVYDWGQYHQSAYSLVCNGVTVCAGYSKTLNLLLNAAGVESIVNLGPGHAWNSVQVHDIWYEMDVTWDDNDGYSPEIVYLYYNKSWDTFVENGHVKESPYTKIDLNEDYDSEHNYQYYNPYFTSGGNTYFIVNDNTSLNPRMVKRVEGTAALPQTVTYNGRTYNVIPEAGANAGAVNEQQIRAFIERMYTVALGRAAEAGGLNFYTNLLIAGDSNGACLAESFLTSPEFNNKGYDNSQYVKVLYKTFFNREPAADEVNYWVGQLNSGKSRAFVLSGFVNSNEFDSLCTSYGIARGFMKEDGKPITPGISRFAERLYTKILGREGEKEGIEYWSLMIANGTCTPQQAAASMYASAEYKNKQTTNVQYVESLYRTFMGREPEVGGVSYWKNLLTNGTTRENILEGFANSAEFKGILQSFGL